MRKSVAGKRAPGAGIRGEAGPLVMGIKDENNKKITAAIFHTSVPIQGSLLLLRSKLSSPLLFLEQH